jgi:hypothetical protein
MENIQGLQRDLNQMLAELRALKTALKNDDKELIKEI